MRSCPVLRKWDPVRLNRNKCKIEGIHIGVSRVRFPGDEGNWSLEALSGWASRPIR